MSRTGKAPRLGPHLAEPYAEFHPKDAAKYGATSGDLLRLNSAQGTAILRALVTDRATQGQIFAPMHWTRQIARGGTINSLTPPVTDPFSGQPALKSGALTAEVYEAKWYGYLATSSRPELATAYAAIARTQTGWQMEMADVALPEDWEALAHQITGLDNVDIAQKSDDASGLIRLGIYSEGFLQALFFAAPAPVVMSRGTAIAHIGTDVSPLVALAGRTAADQPDPGPTVCACFNIGRHTILDAIAGGAGTVPAIGEKTCAGTNCGSCKPELATLLAQSSLSLAAE
jgi:assimilatory nitrate reductase catalytic subunit